jgi:hypothetical protein
MRNTKVTLVASYSCLALAVLLPSFLTSKFSAAQTPGSMNIGAIAPNHWPSPSPTIMRPRSGAEWQEIETARGTFNFALMDQWTTAAEANNAQILFTFLDVPVWASGNVTTPPSDLNNTNETCQGPLQGVVRPGGDCIFAEFVTALMRHECGVTSAPPTPLTGSVCKIRIFEAWNEFNDGQFWSSQYTDMAKTANDAATIVRQYCGDCTFLAGNVSAGGDGYNATYYDNPNVSGIFNVALGQLLDAWKAIPNASLPDAVSFHGYGARRNVIPYPMPETNVSIGSSLCTAANVPNPNCRTAVFEETAAVRATLQERSWAASLPIWNTEGGFGRNDDMTDNVSQTDSNTTFLRQAYVARWMLAMASSGTVTNLWYEFDDSCWGTMMGYGTPQALSGCPDDPAIPSGFTPIHQTWVQMLSFLSDASFNDPCTSSGTIWSCTIVKAGETQEFIWTTQWLGSSSVTVSSTYHQYVDLTGTVHPFTGNTVTLTNQPILLQPGSSSTTPFSITPTTATVNEGATYQLTASATASWTTTCGSISSSGLYKASLYASTGCVVTATATGGSGSATAEITVVSPIVMTPVSATTPQGSTQQFTASMPVNWTAKCGTITSGGLFTATAAIGTDCTIEGIATVAPLYTVYGYDKVSAVSSFAISPQSPTVSEGGTQQFTASSSATFAASCGTITSAGLFTSPLIKTSCTVTAKQVSGTGSASAVVTVTSPLTITPASATTVSGQTQQFTANMPATWTSSCSGMNATTGLFTSPAAQGTVCSITATATGAVAYTAAASDTIGASGVFSVTPASGTVQENATQQFTASASANWTTTCGSISSSGLYKAPLYPSTTCTVTATATSGGESAKAQLTLVSPIVMTPVSASTALGQTQQFTANMPVTWTAKCGTITSGGLYTANGTVDTDCTIEAIATGTIKYTAYGYDKIVQ